MVRVFGHLFKRKCRKNPRQNGPLDCFSEQLLKILKLKIDILKYGLTVLSPRSQVDKWYGQSLITIPTPSQRWGGGGGFKQKGGGGVNGKKKKPKTI